jgi:hypothetical protein
MSGELNLRSNSSAADVIKEFKRVYAPQIEAAFSRFHKTAQESLLVLVTRTIAELAC